MNVIFDLDTHHIQRLHALYQNEWWTRGRTLEETRQCVAGSPINIGIVDERDTLQAYARVLTDYTFKALIFDVIVAPNQRGRGLGERLIATVKSHVKLQGVKHFELYCLPEMVPFYEKQGFLDDVGGVVLMRLENSDKRSKR